MTFDKEFQSGFYTKETVKNGPVDIVPETVFHIHP